MQGLSQITLLKRWFQRSDVMPHTPHEYEERREPIIAKEAYGAREFAADAKKAGESANKPGVCHVYRNRARLSDAARRCAYKERPSLSMRESTSQNHGLIRSVVFF